MAYKRKANRSGTRKRASNARVSYGRRTNSAAPRKRSSGRSARGASGNRGQTIRIVLEQPSTGGAAPSGVPAGLARALTMLAGDRTSAARKRPKN